MTKKAKLAIGIVVGLLLGLGIIGIVVYLPNSLESIGLCIKAGTKPIKLIDISRLPDELSFKSFCVTPTVYDEYYKDEGKPCNKSTDCGKNYYCISKLRSCKKDREPKCELKEIKQEIRKTGEGICITWASMCNTGYEYLDSEGKREQTTVVCNP